MKILIACEESQRVCIEFRKLGHESYSADIIDCSGGHPEWHIKGDVLDILNDGWDMMIAFPPCTFLCNSGVRWLYEKPGRWEQMRGAAIFFKKLLDAKIPRKAIENPRMHKHAIEIIGRRQDQVIHPWEHGHGETKATCLWLENLSPIMPTEIVEGREARIHRMAPGPDRSKERSKTFPGIAVAMAKYWGFIT